jgi:hypothetical protein
MSYDQARHEEMIRLFLEREAEIELNRRPQRLAREELRATARIYLSSLAMTLKAKCRSPENEWRILVIQTAGANHFELLTREDGVCFFELPICIPEIVTEVILGPRCSLGAEELRQWLDAAGLSSVTIRQSSCQCSESRW